MITDNTAKWKAVKLTEFAGKSLPVGFMHFSLEKEVPAGELPASGYLYNRTLYADLWTYAQKHGLVISESEWQAIASANDGNCAYYSSGNGSTTFRVPKLPNTIASDVPSEVPVAGNGNGLMLSEGKRYLPLTTYGIQYNPLGIGHGLPSNLALGSPVTNAGTAKVADVVLGVTTDASKSGIVAKTSATKITGQWLIVAFGVAHNIGEADVANVMQTVEQVQTQISHVDSKIKPFLPDYNACVTIPSFPYTAPTDGFVFIALDVPAGKAAFLKVDNWFLDAAYNPATGNRVYYTQGFVKKGSVITAHENSGFGSEKYFYPLKASV